MFQNINSDAEEIIEDVQSNEKKNKILQNAFSKQNIILYIISFMISTVGISTDIAPFAISVLASCLSNSIPIGIVYVLTCIGTLIGLGTDQFLLYILTSLVFVGIVMIKRPDYDENGRVKLTVRLAIACLVVKLGGLLFNEFLVYDLLQGIMYTISACVFYKIFTGSINVIKDFKIKQAFSVEEVIGASLIIAIAVAGFKDITIFNYSVKNILSILIVLILGWQNGVLIGATSGITIGVVLGIIGQGDIMQVAAYAISGMIAGLLNRLGKPGVIAGFLIGNGVLSYVATGNAISIIMIQEILIASIGLLAVPKKVKINIEDMFDKTKYLPKAPEKRIEQNEETIYKLNNVSEAISEIAKSYKEVAATVLEEDEINLEENKEKFIDEFKNSIVDMENNILYEDLIDDTSSILEDIFIYMISKEIIDRKGLLEILENHNNYILGLEDDNIGKQINEDIDNIIKAINNAYRISKINFIWKKKIDENKRTMGDQLDGISKTISSIANNIAKKEPENKEKEIEKLLEQKGINVISVKVNEESNRRKEIEVQTKICDTDKIEECNSEKIQKVLSKLYNEEIVLEKNTCPLSNNIIIDEKDYCYFKFVSKDTYSIKIGIAKATKNDSKISGDSSIRVKLDDGKHLIAISDGMGSGPEAKKNSKLAVQMLKKLLISGFDKQTSIELINSSMCLNTSEDSYATLDIAILDLYKGNIEFIKNGAAPTYIKNKKNVNLIKSESLPTGIINDIDLTVYDKDIENNDILVMCSDGIIESNKEYDNKELWLKFLLEDMETEDPQKMSEIILNEAVDNNYGMPKDDMTVIVLKFEKQKV